MYIFFSGLHATYKYCDKFKLPYKRCGKLVVATNQIEVDRLESLYSRAIQNKVPDVKLLDDEKAIQEIEPYCKGLKAIHSPHTGNYLVHQLLELRYCWDQKFYPVHF